MFWMLIGLQIVLRVQREHPLSTYANFFGILNPLPPLVRFSRNLSLLSYAKIGQFFDTPPPPQRVRTLWMLPYSVVDSVLYRCPEF